MCCGIALGNVHPLCSASAHFDTQTATVHLKYTVPHSPTDCPLAVPRDDAQSKMLALKEKMDKELAQHDAEIKELKRVIDHNRKLKEFMSKKGKGACPTIGRGGWVGLADRLGG